MRLICTDCHHDHSAAHHARPVTAAYRGIGDLCLRVLPDTGPCPGLVVLTGLFIGEDGKLYEEDALG